MKSNSFSFFLMIVLAGILPAIYAQQENIGETVETDAADSADRTVSEIIETTSGSQLSNQDSNTTSTDTLKTDTLPVINKNTANSTSAPSAEKNSGQYEKPDPFFGLGGGWTLGSMPYFSEWNSMISDTPSISLIRNIWTDNDDISYSVTEDPGSYTAAFPLSLAFTPVIRDSLCLSAFISFKWLKKEYKGKFVSEDIDLKWENYRKVVFSDLFCGIKIQRLIPKRYLLISGTENISLNAGLSAAPLVIVSNTERESSNKLNKDYHKKTICNAFGLGWETGISSYRTLKNNYILEAGICYSGKWYGLFNQRGLFLQWKNLNGNYEHPDELISFAAHRFKMYFIIHFTPKIFDIQETEEKSSPVLNGEFPKY